MLSLSYVIFFLFYTMFILVVVIIVYLLVGLSDPLYCYALFFVWYPLFVACHVRSGSHFVRIFTGELSHSYCYTLFFVCYVLFLVCYVRSTNSYVLLLIGGLHALYFKKSVYKRSTDKRRQVLCWKEDFKPLQNTSKSTSEYFKSSSEHFKSSVEKKPSSPLLNTLYFLALFYMLYAPLVVFHVLSWNNYVHMVNYMANASVLLDDKCNCFI